MKKEAKELPDEDINIIEKPKRKDKSSIVIKVNDQEVAEN